MSKWKACLLCSLLGAFSFPLQVQIRTATIALKDLMGDQSESLPYKPPVSLLNERGQKTGEISLLSGWLCSDMVKHKDSLKVTL